jgi:hypothetical protein
MVPGVAEDILLAQEVSNWIRTFLFAAPSLIATIGKNKLVIIHPVRSNARKNFLFTYSIELKITIYNVDTLFTHQPNLAIVLSENEKVEKYTFFRKFLICSILPEISIYVNDNYREKRF